MKNLSHFLSLLSLGALLAAVSCSGTTGDYCDKKQNCEGGNDADYDACVAGANASSDIADDYDCGDQYGKYFDCAADKSTCNNGRLDGSPCASESTSLLTCLEAAKGKKTDNGKK